MTQTVIDRVPSSTTEPPTSVRSAVQLRSMRDGQPISPPWWIVERALGPPEMSLHGGERDRRAARRGILRHADAEREEACPHDVGRSRRRRAPRPADGRVRQVACRPRPRRGRRAGAPRSGSGMWAIQAPATPAGGSTSSTGGEVGDGDAGIAVVGPPPGDDADAAAELDRCARLGQVPGRADQRVAGERQLVPRSEDPRRSHALGRGAEVDGLRVARTCWRGPASRRRRGCRRGCRAGCRRPHPW